MLLALLLAAATPPVEQEQIDDRLHRFALPAANVATVAEGQAALLAEARDACAPSLPAFGSFTLDGERFEQELLCLPPREPGEPVAELDDAPLSPIDRAPASRHETSSWRQCRWSFAGEGGRTPAQFVAALRLCRAHAELIRKLVVPWNAP